MIRTGSGALYTGIATDVDRRLEEHRDGRLGAKYLRSRGPLEVVYRVELGERGLALRAETRVKRLTKTGKERLVRDGPQAGCLLRRLGLDDAARRG